MSQALADILSLTEQLRLLAGSEDWSTMLAVAKQRQQLLEHYFGQAVLADTPAVVRQAMATLQQVDQHLAAQARQHRQQLLSDAVDLRQRWQMSDAYQRVQNLQT